ncbi:hypothetical protein ACFL6S_18495 [Candidatus Poribacteria bacterium]
MKKMPMVAIISALVLASGLVAAALPFSFESKAEFNEVIDSWEGTPEDFVEAMEFACKNAEGPYTKRVCTKVPADNSWGYTYDCSYEEVDVTTKFSVSDRVYDRATRTRYNDPARTRIQCSAVERISSRRVRITSLWNVKNVDMTAEELSTGRGYYNVVGTRAMEFPLPTE